MKLFSKNTPKKTKRELFIRLASVLVAGVVLEIAAFLSVAWFASSGNVNATRMQVVVACDSYDLLVDRSNPLYEADASYYIDIAKSGLFSEGYNLSSDSTSSETTKIAFELTNELSEGDKLFLQPGSYGILEFYLRPQSDGDITVDFNINIGGYSLIYDNLTPSSVSVVTNSAVLDYLKGHLLFFENRTGANPAEYQYSGLITNGVYSYSTNGKSKSEEVGKEDCYKITLYWEWPSTYSEIDEHTPVNNNDPEIRYPYELRGYLSSHPEYFFASYQDSIISSELNEGYNDADQAIGMFVDYVVVSMIGS